MASTEIQTETEVTPKKSLLEEYAPIAKDGLWNNNAVFAQMLGLCPLLAVSNSVVNALGLGIATIMVMILSNVSVSLIRNIVRPEIRLPVFVVIIASAVTAIELIIHAWFHELYLVLGIFIPLIVTNCAIIARAEAFASKNTVSKSFFDGLMMGLGFALVLVTLGALREVIGMGTLFANAHIMFGEGMHWLTIEVFSDYDGFLLAILPPGAFIGLAFLLAARNYIEKKRTQRKKQNKQQEPVALEASAV
ncbi:MAG: electron transport complex subunit E [gamma proteobacterium symbiont of Bathyaustriella thionipta]|nr:electron transport complex subunit E [gamma proteobacterium symbiont of Bathyaustriella thionipta]MCU7949108.1 electron transport complex subunit E [gamma proteobacterium symbiont of Bathyaustriella thionipta]MCU7952804.1 electron transport complex subunit E [gamma proteobacterium symbiont of Bathyaustriella thionipta]MCU7955695.1 electron transport complex subunit E [gamma proteobacterium symbiont of Bathyaustriella thionipta]MCU7968009.1 electron transport complex subunit E [gamma proteoba